MLKDKLKIQNINQDLRSATKNACIELVEISLAFIIVLLIIVFVYQFISSVKVLLGWLLCCSGEVALLVLLIRKINRVRMFYEGYKNDKIIVIDKLINTEIKHKGFGNVGREKIII